MADAAANDVPPRFKIDIQKVKLGEQLGHGANGSVFKAVLLDTNEIVAVKDVFTDDDKTVVASCRSLCKTLITLHSEYIVRFLGMSESPKHLYFITELATGGSLMQALQSHPMRNDLAMLLRWALDIVSGLAYLHSQQPRVLHLDIKPQNVLLFGCGLAKLCDFDISQVTEHTITAAREGATYRYAAPEQLLVGGMVSAATDIYGLGGVLYVMALKKEPWSDIPKPLDIMHKHFVGEDIKIPSPLPPDCHACIMAIAAECLHRNPQVRPTLVQVKQKLRSLLCDSAGAQMRSAPPNAAGVVVGVQNVNLDPPLPTRSAKRPVDNVPADDANDDGTDVEVVAAANVNEVSAAQTAETANPPVADPVPHAPEVAPEPAPVREVPAQAAEPQKQPSAEPAAAPKPARKPNVVYDDPEQKAVLDLISLLFQCDAAHDLLHANCTTAFGNIVKRRFSDDPFCGEVHVDIDRQALRGAVISAGNRAIECGNLVRAEEILESSLTVFRHDDVIEYNLACAASLMGKLEKSMAMLRLAMQHGYHNLNDLRKDPDLAAVRAHPQFRILVEPLRMALAPAATCIRSAKRPVDNVPCGRRQ